ncbi:Adaptin N terminal region family protein [Trichomonas vaginalis G3]|uniref:Adaptin N terminal region family protein n=1 Tax=Trichomonas vaginalis (strain ATCC PRA-98 / G3) TaxID=412133 RepID=A2DAM8_TRIV3|nr:clathrin binding [Trichomonas vaginalis G3]EAY22531.1 Adaptin N terminal region family protein [Trichomonas vaginalis G3]KAI5497264.1 clathrin binding [Trichomonas vaginalis G3]|eukprot:XP_001583517.1 Adaptin N terminal region family protein [Trichomonas vaginalis G3]
MSSAALPEPSENQEEIKDLQNKLSSNYPKERKDAAKNVIALMRAGENVQELFSDMLRCVKTDDLELKKLVYLYLVNYSTTEPEQAIMAVNTFVQDSEHDNPLIRALAVRTMCRINLESVAEHMIQPLKKCLKDADPYVRKTAAFGVSKLYDVLPEAVENSGLFPDLLSLLTDENPLVVSNTTAALFEINSHRNQPVLQLTAETLTPILAALSSCSEWCQVMLLDALAKYTPISSEDASYLIDRLIPFLKNSNPSVVVGSFKCIFMFMDHDTRKPHELFPQIIPPFITLVASSEPEIQYVVLRTLSLFVHKFPKALAKEIRVFFCKYNDPSYVKMEKLDIIVTICTQQTAQIVLDELSEYCNAVDVAFVKKAVRCIGQIAMKIEAAAPRCVDILVGLVDGKADYAIEESVVVVSDILRRFPGSFESVIAAVCKNFDQIKDPHSKAAAVWILGEYCHIIEGVDLLLDPFLDSFHDEQPEVQLQILTSLVKVFIDRPNDTRDQLQFVLTEATKGDVSPDVRNRAYIYWRLLSAEGNISQLVVKFDKVKVSSSGEHYEDSVLSELIRNMGSVAGVLHVVPGDFVHRVCYENRHEDEEVDEERDWIQAQITKNENVIDLFVDFEPTTMHIKIVNRSQQDISDLALALNVNPVGLVIPAPPVFPRVIPVGQSCEVDAPIVFTSEKQGQFNTNLLDLAIKTNAGPVYARVELPAQCAAMVDGRLDQMMYKDMWAKIPVEDSAEIAGAALATDEALRDRNVFVVGRKENQTYISLKLQPGVFFLVEAVEDGPKLTIHFKTSDSRLSVYLKKSAYRLFATKQ